MSQLVKNKSFEKKKLTSDLVLATLLEDMCYLLEWDKDKASKIYNNLSNKLKDIGLLKKDDISLKEDSVTTRNLIRNFLGHLFKNSQLDLLNDTQDDYKSDSRELIRQPSFNSLVDYVKDEKMNNTDMKIILDTTCRFTNDFIKLDQLGEGSFGMVDKVYHKIDGIIYAVKKIPFIDKLSNDEFKEKVNDSFKEVRLLAKMNHINILRYNSSWIEYYYWEESFEGSSDKSINELEGTFLTLFLQTELCDFSLNGLLEEKKLNISQKKDIINQICDGLIYLHENEIIHRDIKPENLFLLKTYRSKDTKILLDKESDEKFLVKIGDFGLSKKIKMEFDNENIIGAGTELYSAPEQIRNNNYSEKSDIYSLGLVIYEMFSKFNSNLEKISSINSLKKGNYQLLNHIKHSEIIDVIIKCINIDPDKRISLNEIKTIIN